MTQHAKGKLTDPDPYFWRFFFGWLIATLVLGGGLSIYAIVSQAIQNSPAP